MRLLPFIATAFLHLFVARAMAADVHLECQNKNQGGDWGDITAELLLDKRQIALTIGGAFFWHLDIEKADSTSIEFKGGRQLLPKARALMNISGFLSRTTGDMTIFQWAREVKDTEIYEYVCQPKRPIF